MRRRNVVSDDRIISPNGEKYFAATTNGEKYFAATTNGEKYFATTGRYAIHHRRSIRLPGYDYSQPGAYFVTMCTHDRRLLFGNVVDGIMVLNDTGRIAEQCWNAIPDHFPNVELNVHVVMPDHIHGIIFIRDMDGNATAGAKNISPLPSPPSVGAKYFSPLPSPPSVGAKYFSPRPQQQLTRPRGTSQTIGSIVRGFKIGVTTWIRQNEPGFVVWQRGYFERVIRNDTELQRIRYYIMQNPEKWGQVKHRRRAMRRETPVSKSAS